MDTRDDADLLSVQRWRPQQIASGTAAVARDTGWDALVADPGGVMPLHLTIEESLSPRLRSPVDLDLGGHGPEANALRIAAQLQQPRYSA